jgi:hypothetical protein
MWDQKDIQEAFQKISKRAMTDKSFRELSLKDAAQAIKEETGKELPADLKIKFVENSEGADATFVLPNFKADLDELNEKELDAVAGGSAACKGTAHTDNPNLEDPFHPCFFSSII